jgi:hypothetical protein
MNPKLYDVLYVEAVEYNRPTSGASGIILSVIKIFTRTVGTAILTVQGD